MILNKQLKEKIDESVSAVLPITVIMLLLSILVVPMHQDACALLGRSFMLIIVCFLMGIIITILDVVTMQDVMREFVKKLPKYCEEVALSMLPVLFVFVLFELLSKTEPGHLSCTKKESALRFPCRWTGL